MKWKVYFLIGALNLCLIQLKGQSIAWAFNQAIYTPDTSLTKYLYKGIYNLAQLDSAYDRFKFSSNEFYASYGAISTSNFISPSAGNSYKLDFTLNSKSSSSYFYKIDTGNKSTAIFAIPGSGTNQSSNILSNPANYHNVYGSTFYGIANTSLKYGDFYLYIKPNEDVRAMRYGNYKLSDLNLYPILTNRGTSYTSNLFIECFAIIKYLKSKYSKVIVVGLSQGGTSSLICSIETEPDDALICSGYSAIWDTAFYASGPSGLIQDSIFNVYSSSNIKDSMLTNISHYFYSWGNADVASLSSEYYYHTSENVFGNHCNIKYHYGVYTHYYPFQQVDTFLKNAIKRPKLIVSHNTNTCLADSMILNLKLIGKPPFALDLFKDSVLYQSYIVNDTSYSITLSQEGMYQFFNIVDTNNIPLCKSRQIQYVKSLKPSVNYSYKGRDCLMQTDSIELYLHGTKPFQLNSQLIGISNNYVTTDSTLLVSLPQGNYPLISILDSSMCAVVLTDTIKVIHDTLSALVSDPIYICDSNKSKIHIELSGTAPWKVNYLRNGVQYQISTSQDTFNLFLNNGVYNFLNVIDSTNCVYNLNKFFLINFSPINSINSTPNYICDSVKSKIDFSFQGNSPFDIYYTLNGNLYVDSNVNSNWSSNFGNGNYVFSQIIDSTGCVFQIGQAYNFQFDTLNCIVGNPVYDCDSNLTKVHFSLQGNLPWKINYSKDGVAHQIVTSNNQLDAYFPNGLYTFLSAEDNTGCVKLLNESFNFNYSQLQASFSSPVYICDSSKSLLQINLSGNKPYTLNYTNNTIPQSLNLTSNSWSIFLSNGNYNYINVSDSTGCNLPVSQYFFLNYNSLNFNIQPPEYNCDSNKTLFHFNFSGNFPIVLNYTENGVSKQEIIYQNNFNLFVNNGLYSFISITDATNCTKLIGQSYNVNFQPLSAAITQQSFDCDSSKFRVNFDLHGNPPWQIQYSENGIPYTSNTNDPNFKLYLNNGNWFINSISDITGCIQNVNVYVPVYFQPIDLVIQNQNYNCDSSKLQVDFNLYGNAPWILNFVKNGTSPQYYSAQLNQSNSSLYFENGNYTLLSLTDNANCIKNLNSAIINNYNPLTYQMVSQNYNCDSSALQVNNYYGGDSPWTLVYQDVNSGAYSQSISNSQNNSILLTNGDYSILTISDAKCTLNVNDTLHSNFQKLVSSLSPMKVDCDSGKNEIKFITSSGFKPYHYQYFYNSQLQNIISYTDTTTLYLSNGTYFFSNVTDSIGCLLNFNQSIQSNYLPFSFNSITNKYDCQKDSTQIILDIQYSNPIWLVFSSASNPNDTLAIGNDFFVPNGLYYWKSVYDSIGCEQSLNLADSISNMPVSFDLDSIQPNCADKIYNLNMSFHGKSPWELIYNFANVTNSKIVQDTNSVWSVNAGNYYFVSIKDANQCEKMIATEIKLSDYLPDHPLIEYRSEKLFTIGSQVGYTWFKDGEIIDSTSGSEIYTQGDGLYYVIIQDSNGCIYQSQNIILNDINSIVLYPNPVTSKTMLKINDEFDEFWRYVISDMSGQTLFNGIETKHTVEFNFESLARGVYNINVQYQSPNGYKNEVIRLIKN